MKEWDDEAEYRKRYPSKEDRSEDEVSGGYYAEGLPEEFYFVWHILRERDGRYRVVIDWFLPWDAVDWGFDYLWRSKEKAVLWARYAVRAFGEVERDFVKEFGVDPGVIQAIEEATIAGDYDNPALRPGREDKTTGSMNGARGRKIRGQSI